MRRLIAFIILATVKTISMIFWRAEANWLTSHPEDPWKYARLMVFLNHTSLYEVVYIQLLPYTFLWHLAGHLNVPGADITLNRPLVGKFWKLMIPKIQSISRKKDNTWTQYLNTIDDQSTIIIAPEGRMKRPNGLDKDGKPMSIRGGIVDILDGLDHGGMVVCLSGGLHHIQVPGQHLPRLFKRIKMNLEYHDIKSYKNSFSNDPREKKVAMVKDLQKRLENNCPQMP